MAGGISLGAPPGQASKKTSKELGASPAGRTAAKSTGPRQERPDETRPAAAADGETGASPRPKGKKRSEMDDLFATIKGRKAESEKRAQEEKKEKEMKRPKVQGSKDDIFGEAPVGGRKRTDEGYAIYTEDELRVSSTGGSTAQCPFDCDCCY